MQFSIRALLGLTTLCAVLAAVFFVGPMLLALTVMLVLALVMPGIFAVAILHGGQYLRAFCIGAIVPAAALGIGAAFEFVDVVDAVLLGTVRDPEYTYTYFRVATVAAWVIIIIGGLACMLTLWLLQKWQKR